MVDLVEDRARLEAFALEHSAQVLHLDPRGPADVRRHVGQAEAALARDLGALARGHVRVGQDDEAVRRLRLRVLGDVHDGDPDQLADLRGGDPDAALIRRGRVDQELGDPLDIIGLDGGSDLFEDRVGVEKDGAGRHGRL